MKYKGLTFKNNLERSMSRVYTMGVHGQIKTEKDLKEFHKHFRYIKKWIRENGGDIPK